MTRWAAAQQPTDTTNIARKFLPQIFSPGADVAPNPGVELATGFIITLSHKKQIYYYFNLLMERMGAPGFGRLFNAMRGPRMQYRIERSNLEAPDRSRPARARRSLGRRCGCSCHWLGATARCGKNCCAWLQAALLGPITAVLDRLFATDTVSAGRRLVLLIDGAIVHAQMGQAVDAVMEHFKALVDAMVRR